MSDKKKVEEEIEVESVEETVDETQQLKDEVALLKDKMLRNAAELENFKRRTNEEKQNFMRYAVSEVMSDLISVIDNFDRALNALDGQLDDKSLEGINMIYEQVNSITKKNGVEVVETVGEKFDPNFHQAVMTGNDDNYESGIVIEEFQKGYKIKDKILRPAMVKVNE